MPNIKELSDVYETGVLCNARIMHDEKNFFMPYIMNLFPVEKASLISAASEVETVEPLMRVMVDKIREELLHEGDLNMNDVVMFKFLKQ